MIASKASQRQAESENTWDLKFGNIRITADFMSRTVWVKPPCVKGGTHPQKVMENESPSLSGLTDIGPREINPEINEDKRNSYIHSGH